MNLRCKECARQSYSASPEIVIRNQIRCGDCGGELVPLDDERDDPLEEAGGGDDRFSGA